MHFYVCMHLCNYHLDEDKEHLQHLQKAAFSSVQRVTTILNFNTMVYSCLFLNVI